jgi:hypothetical protein
MGEQRGLDLAEFHPLPADLHLPVRAPDEDDVPGGVHADQVAGPVQPHAVAGERIRHEPRRRPRWITQISPGQARTTEVQLANGATRHRPEPFVQDMATVVVHRPPDGRWRPHRASAVGVEHSDRRLGRPVPVDHPAPR